MALLIKSGYSAANLLITAAGFWGLSIITHLQRNLNEYYIIAFSLPCWENVYFIFNVIMYVHLGIGIVTTILFWIVKPEWRSKLLLYSWMFTISVVLVMLQFMVYPPFDEPDKQIPSFLGLYFTCAVISGLLYGVIWFMLNKYKVVRQQPYVIDDQR